MDAASLDLRTDIRDMGGNCNVYDTRTRRLSRAASVQFGRNSYYNEYNFVLLSEHLAPKSPYLPDSNVECVL